MKHIVLVGFMGAGKSTMGRQLAEHFKTPFYDLDDQIEKGEKRSISDLIERSEPYFRKLETAYLKQLLNKPKGIVALGGGAFCQITNQNILESRNCQTIYLEMSSDFCRGQLDIIRDSRPLLKQIKDEDWQQKALDLYDKRRPVYEQANLTFLVDSWNTKTLITKIENRYGKVF